VVLLGLAVLDCGPRLQAGFLHVDAGGFSLGGAVNDFAGDRSICRPANELLSSPSPSNEFSGLDFGSHRSGQGPAAPSSTASSGSPSPVPAFAGLLKAGGPEAPLRGAFLLSRKRGLLPNPVLSSLFRPPRLA